MNTKPPPLLGALSSNGSLDPDAVSRDFTPVQTGNPNVGFVLSGAELTTTTIVIPPNGEISKTLSFMRRMDNSGLVFTSVPESASIVPVAAAFFAVISFVALRGRRART